jgi:hypothetical protein
MLGDFVESSRTCAFSFFAQLVAGDQAAEVLIAFARFD